MAQFDIESFRSHFKAGARQYLFYVEPKFPASIQPADRETPTYLVRTSSLPASSIEPTTINWQGFDFKMGGKSVFNEWTVEYNVDQEARIRQYFIDWMKLIHDPETNIYGKFDDYMVNYQDVQLLSLNGQKSVMTYKLHGIWPSEIGEIILDYAGTEIATFNVTYTYQYHTVIS